MQKRSKRGWPCKTREGELAMVTMPGANPEESGFSVRSDAVAEQSDRTLGKRVAQAYQQRLGVPTTCFGDATCFVTGVVSVE